MRKEYDFSKIKATRNPYAGSQWKAIFQEASSIAKKTELTEKDVVKAITSYRDKRRRL